MWKSLLTPEITGQRVLKISTAVGVKFGKVWRGFRVFHRVVKTGEWKVKNRGKFLWVFCLFFYLFFRFFAAPFHGKHPL